MLYGRTNLNQEWELVGEERLLYNDNNKILQIPGLVKALDVERGTQLFFYIFCYKKEERFVFVTKKAVCFRQISSHFPRGIGEFATMIDGVLYDLEKKCFVFSGKFCKFVLYDDGIPNVILDEKTGKHTIFAIKDGEYQFFTVRRTRSREIQFVSHLWKKGKIGRPINNRLIFFVPEAKENYNMLILHEEIEFESLNENVNFENTIPLKDEADSVASYFRSVHGKDGEDVILSHDTKIYKVLKLLVFDDAVCVVQPTGEYNIMFVEDGHFVYDEHFDCFQYRKLFKFKGEHCRENMVEVYFRKNDFENGVSVFNIATGKNM